MLVDRKPSIVDQTLLTFYSLSGGYVAAIITIVRWLMPGLVLYAAHGPLGYFIIVKEGNPMTVLAIQAIAVVACGLITAATIHRYGLIGAALATTCTYGFSAVAKACLFTRYSGTSLRDIFILKIVDVARFRKMAQRAIISRIAALTRVGARL